MFDILTLYRGKISPGKIDEISKKEKISLVDVVKPSKKELEKISKLTGISITKLTEFIDPSERPRVEELNKNSVLIYRYPIHTQKYIRTSSIAIIISKEHNYLIIIQKETDHLIESIKQLEKEEKKWIFEHGPSYVLYKVLDNISSSFFKELDEIENRTDVIEKNILQNKDSKGYIKEILDLKRTLSYFHKAIIANRDVVNYIDKGHLKNIDKQILPFMREVYYDLTQLIEFEETRKEILTGTLDIHMSAISNNLNIVMKRLTVIAALIWIPTLIAAIYGMNFGQPLTGASPFNMPELSWAYGYPFALGLMIVSVLSMYLWFKKQKWI